MNLKKLFLAIFFLVFGQSCYAINILGGLERFYNVAPGEKHEGSILLNNKTDKPVNIKAYLSDFRFNHKGENFFDEPGTLPRSNAKWITFAPERLAIPAKTIGKVDFSIKVPENAGKNGVFWSVIMIEPQAEDDPELMKSTEHGFKIRTVSRFAVQIMTTFGKEKDADKKFKFVDRTVAMSQGKRIYQISARNDGEFYMRPTLWAEIFDLKGRSFGRFTAASRQILPECSTRFNIDITDLPVGEYEALVAADTGQANIVGARYKLKIE